MVTQSQIEGLRPCQPRLDNYLKFYAGRSFRKTQFMGLKNITQADKLWVAFRLMPKENVALAAADIAESVLSVYESTHPNDNRPREAIRLARICAKDPTPTNRAAAYAAAYAARAAARAAAYAARAAARAAAYAARAAAYAAYAAADAAARAAYAAARAAYAAADAAQQEKLIRKIILRYWT